MHGNPLLLYSIGLMCTVYDVTNVHTKQDYILIHCTSSLFKIRQHKFRFILQFTVIIACS